MITRDMSMCQAVIDYPQLLPLFPRFNFQLGFGEKNVEEVCRFHQVNPDFFLEIANAYLGEEFVPAEGLGLFSLGAVIEYLKSTHTYFLEQALPLVESRIQLFLDKSNLAEKEKELVTRFFQDYKKEFLDHIQEEERHVLPYILELEEQSSRDKPDRRFLEKLSSYTIREFELEHDRLETSLENLSQLIIKYLPPPEDFQYCMQVLGDLAALVKDLVDHANMEDKIMIPRVSELEQQLMQKLDSQ